MKNRTFKKAEKILIFLLAGLLTAGCGAAASGRSSADAASTSSGLILEENQSEENVRSESIHLDPSVTAKSHAEGTERLSETASSSESLPAVSSGSDEMLTASSEEDGPLVCIDPGHSAYATRAGAVPVGPGASETKPGDAQGTRGVATGVMEYELTLQISDLLRDELEARGYRVILTREANDVTVDLVKRAEIANEAGADIMVRIHANGSGSSAAAGVLGICITAGNPFISSNYRESRRLTEEVLNSYCASTGLVNTGIWETDSMATSNWTLMPTTLLELGFMTNPDEDRKMEEAGFQKTMVTGIADGIDSYFGRQKDRE